MHQKKILDCLIAAAMDAVVTWEGSLRTRASELIAKWAVGCLAVGQLADDLGGIDLSLISDEVLPAVAAGLASQTLVLAPDLSEDDLQTLVDLDRTLLAQLLGLCKIELPVV